MAFLWEIVIIERFNLFWTVCPAAYSYKTFTSSFWEEDNQGVKEFLPVSGIQPLLP